MTVLTNDDLDEISELVDEIALDKPLDWESVNFEAAKELAILGSVEQYNEIMTSEMSEKEKVLALITIFSYIVLENTQLWIENKRK